MLASELPKAKGKPARPHSLPTSFISILQVEKRAYATDKKEKSMKAMSLFFEKNIGFKYYYILLQIAIQEELRK